MNFTSFAAFFSDVFMRAMTRCTAKNRKFHKTLRILLSGLMGRRKGGLKLTPTVYECIIHLIDWIRVEFVSLQTAYETPPDH